MPSPAGMMSFCVDKNVESSDTGGIAKYETARWVSVVPYMLMIHTFVASACSRRQSRLVRTSPTKNAFWRQGIWRVACADSNCPMAGVRCVTVT